MGGWSLNGIGPQRLPATPGRLRAQRRQIDRENAQATDVRRPWMSIMGCDSDEINELCDGLTDLNLVEELEHLAAAKRLQ